MILKTEKKRAVRHNEERRGIMKKKEEWIKILYRACFALVASEKGLFSKMPDRVVFQSIIRRRITLSCYGNLGSCDFLL